MGLNALMCVDAATVHDVNNKVLITTSLVGALGNLKQLSKYIVNLVPPSQAVFDTFNANGIQLKKFLLLLDTRDPIERHSI